MTPRQAASWPWSLQLRLSYCTSHKTTPLHVPKYTNQKSTMAKIDIHGGGWKVPQTLVEMSACFLRSKVVQMPNHTHTQTHTHTHLHAEHMDFNWLRSGTGAWCYTVNCKTSCSSSLLATVANCELPQANKKLGHVKNNTTNITDTTCYWNYKTAFAN